MSNEIRISVLSQDDVENLCKVTYNQGKIITVHMVDRDFVFHKKNNIYVSDMTDWVTDRGLETARKPLSLATIKSENVTSKETRRDISTK